jgi:hypothetical protein
MEQGPGEKGRLAGMAVTRRLEMAPWEANRGKRAGRVMPPPYTAGGV